MLKPATFIRHEPGYQEWTNSADVLNVEHLSATIRRNGTYWEVRFFAACHPEMAHLEDSLFSLWQARRFVAIVAAEYERRARGRARTDWWGLRCLVQTIVRETQAWKLSSLLDDERLGNELLRPTYDQREKDMLNQARALFGLPVVTW